MADTGRKVEVRFGTFSCSIEGYDNPVEQMREVLLLMQQMIRETPMLADYGPEIGDEEVAQIENALGHRPNGGNGATPGVVVIQAGGAASRGAPEDAVTAAEIEPGWSGAHAPDERTADETAATGVAPVAPDRADDAPGALATERPLDDETGAEPTAAAIFTAPAAKVAESVFPAAGFETAGTDARAGEADVSAFVESAEAEVTEPTLGVLEERPPEDRHEAEPARYAGSFGAESAGPAPEAVQGIEPVAERPDSIAEDRSLADAASQLWDAALDQRDATAIDNESGSAKGELDESLSAAADELLGTAFESDSESVEATPRSWDVSDDARPRHSVDENAAPESAHAGSGKPEELPGTDLPHDGGRWTEESADTQGDWRGDEGEAFGAPEPEQPRYAAAGPGVGDSPGEAGLSNLGSGTGPELFAELDRDERIEGGAHHTTSSLWPEAADPVAAPEPEALQADAAPGDFVAPLASDAAAAEPEETPGTEREAINIFAPPAAAAGTNALGGQPWPEAAAPRINIFAPPAEDGADLAQPPAVLHAEPFEETKEFVWRDDIPNVGEAEEPAAEMEAPTDGAIPPWEGRQTVHAPAPPAPAEANRPLERSGFAAWPAMTDAGAGAGDVAVQEESAAGRPDAPALGRFSALFARLGGRPGPEPRAPSGQPGEAGPARLADRADARSVPDLLAVAGAWLTLVDGKPRFTRREVMEVFESLPGDHPRTLEARIKGFGQLVRSGTLLLVDDGVFAMAQADRDRFQAMLDD